MKNPKISVIITSYNRGDLLHRAVNSVLNQTYKNFEIIIVDDNSIDKVTINHLNNFEKKENIKVYRNSINYGANYSRNFGINKSTGHFYTGLDDDDYFAPNRLNVLVSNYDEKYSFVCDNYYIIKNNISKRRFFFSKKLKKCSLEYENQAGNQIFTTTKKIKESGLFDQELKRLQDQDMWLRMIIKHGNALRINDCTYYMDISHDGNRITEKIKSLSSYKDFFSKHKKNMCLLNIIKNENRIKFLSGESLANWHSILSPKLILKKWLSYDSI